MFVFVNDDDDDDDDDVVVVVVVVLSEVSVLSPFVDLYCRMGNQIATYFLHPNSIHVVMLCHLQLGARIG